MTLPNYFLVDLPAEASLTPMMVREAAKTLKHNRERYLAGRSTGGLIEFLANLGREWLQPDYPFRQMALALPHAQSGFSREILAAGLDQFFSRFTRENLLQWIEQELGQENRLDVFCASAPEKSGRRSSVAFGPAFQVHITSGNLPCPAFTSILSGLLLRSAQFVKGSSRSSALPRLLAHSIYDLDPKLGACLELAAWKGGHEALENALFEEADCVTATGSDDAIASIRKRVPAHTRFLGYGHRVSFSYITQRALAGAGGARLVPAAARDIIAWDQLGCLSPHVIYVEDPDGRTAEPFAARLAAELERREITEPRAAASTAVAATIANRRAFYEVRAAHSPDTRHWFSSKSTAWTVIYEADPLFQLSCLHRFIYVKSVKNTTELLQGVDPVRAVVSTIGLGVAEDQAPHLAAEFARWGAPRLCPIGQMQNPPLAWRHDGRPALAGLVSWSDWEN
jgi:hypothetical protein